MSLSSRRLRDILRIVHLVGALITCAFVYSPFGGEPGFVAAMQRAVIPGLWITGLGMWQLPRLRRWVAGRSARSARPVS